ncbi:GNAT family N-acetyltransferase [Solwaraspora sp. WMMD406]|uniref:GNAT family N-acetyltransferase n=1 Tax=Solwaraspora sp. WMMD406 TaxID=3016095 RepID=UPI0024163DE0|nr:GNAT family N-acetyltransferase [Solwaraspora sp. WMMD406]MDG4767775.1 GNAT family N-acetyltransferase [Solwaraspora sp. WMMD406]
MLRPQDVGRRVVVRKIIGVGAGRPRYTDHLGLLAEMTETELTVLTRHGPRQVPLTEVHRSKIVPASASTSARQAASRDAARVTRLELVANEAWPAPEQHRLGDWLLRAADGWTGRANSALPLGDPGRPLPAAIDAVRTWYAERGLPPQFNVPLPAAAPVAEELARGGGWRTRPLVLVQTAPLAELVARATERPDLPAVRLDPRPSAGWLALATASKSPTRPDAATPAAAGPAGTTSTGTTGGTGATGDSVTLPAAARHLLTTGNSVRFAHLADGDDLLAIARASLSADGHWCAVLLVEVVPSARRRGLATHLLRAIAHWAGHEMGARTAFLQVEQRNPATELYRRLGFTTHHAYLPWQAVSDGPLDAAC